MLRNFVPITVIPPYAKNCLHSTTPHHHQHHHYTHYSPFSATHDHLNRTLRYTPPLPRLTSYPSSTPSTKQTLLCSHSRQPLKKTPLPLKLCASQTLSVILYAIFNIGSFHLSCYGLKVYSFLLSLSCFLYSTG